VKGFRDIIAHHYFDIDAEQVFWMCKHSLEPLSLTIKKMIEAPIFLCLLRQSSHRCLRRGHAQAARKQSGRHGPTSSPASIELIAEPKSVALRDQVADMLKAG